MRKEKILSHENAQDPKHRTCAKAEPTRRPNTRIIARSFILFAKESKMIRKIQIDGCMRQTEASVRVCAARPSQNKTLKVGLVSSVQPLTTATTNHPDCVLILSSQIQKDLSYLYIFICNSQHGASSNRYRSPIGILNDTKSSVANLDPIFPEPMLIFDP